MKYLDCNKINEWRYNPIKGKVNNMEDHNVRLKLRVYENKKINTIILDQNDNKILNLVKR